METACSRELLPWWRVAWIQVGGAGGRGPRGSAEPSISGDRATSVCRSQCRRRRGDVTVKEGYRAACSPALHPKARGLGPGPPSGPAALLS